MAIRQHTASLYIYLYMRVILRQVKVRAGGGGSHTHIHTEGEFVTLLSLSLSLTRGCVYQPYPRVALLPNRPCFPINTKHTAQNSTARGGNLTSLFFFNPRRYTCAYIQSIYTYYGCDIYKGAARCRGGEKLPGNMDSCSISGALSAVAATRLLFLRLFGSCALVGETILCYICGSVGGCTYSMINEELRKLWGAFYCRATIANNDSRRMLRNDPKTLFEL